MRRHKITTHRSDFPTDDNVYVDIKVSNNTNNRTIPAIYNQTRTVQILDNPSNYYLTLVRWKCPAFEFPLLIFQPLDNQPDPNVGVYTVTLETNTDIVTENLYLYSYNDEYQPPTQNADGTWPITPYYFIYTYQQFLNIVNFALTLAFDKLTGKPAAALTAPEMRYEPENKLFSIYAIDQVYEVNAVATYDSGTDTITPPDFEPTSGDGIKIYFNYKLFSLFNGLNSRITEPDSAESTNNRDVQILFQNLVDNDINGQLQMRQDFTSIPFWSPVKQIAFITELIPINAENTTTSTNSFRKILTDFEPIADSDQDVRTTLQYFPQGVYRLTDVIGTSPLYRIDLKAIWTDIDGNEFDVLIPPFQQFSAKILFMKRNLVKNNIGLFEH